MRLILDFAAGVLPHCSKVSDFSEWRDCMLRRRCEELQDSGVQRFISPLKSTKRIAESV